MLLLHPPLQLLTHSDMGRWNPMGFKFFCFWVLVSGFQGSSSLNSEGVALLKFRAGVDSDPYGCFLDWNPFDTSPCLWSGVHCMDSKVRMLNLSSCSLGGTLTPELAQLTELRALILYENRFYGVIPKEFGALTKLELLDLRNNFLSGKVPEEIVKMVSLKRLLLGDNKFEGCLPLELERLNFHLELQFDDNLEYVGTTCGCANRKFGWRTWLTNRKKLKSWSRPIKGALVHYLNVLLLTSFNVGKESQPHYGNNYVRKESQPHYGNNYIGSRKETMLEHDAHNFVIVSRRRLLEQSSNLAAEPASDGSSFEQTIAPPITRSSGKFPAVPKSKNKTHDSASAPTPSRSVSSSSGVFSQNTEKSSGEIWKYVIVIFAMVSAVMAAAVIILVCRSKRVKTIGPWKTGLSGQLQKAFVTGVPKLNKSELDTACEDFSNITESFNGFNVYKGTLSNGVEIAVGSTSVTCSRDWSKNSEIGFRKKIDLLSRINHKNFVNLIGYCAEDEPFSRMMVFEYAPNGRLIEHLQDEGMEHLDWNTRMRIVMGTAYCLKYMHHDMNPPIPHSNPSAATIYLTDDYAAKLAEISPVASDKFKSSDNNEPQHSSSSSSAALPPPADLVTNVYTFGVLLLEIISGKLSYSEEYGPLEKWAAQYLNNSKNITEMIDPTLKSFNNEELSVICGVIQDCIKPDPSERPTIKDVIMKLREVINISPEQATPRLSPLWWAELEILSQDSG